MIRVAAIVLLTTGCSSDRKPRNMRERGPVAVEVSRIERGTISHSLTYVGELRAPESVELASKIPGRARSVLVNMGDRVEKGQMLAQLDDGDIRAQRNEAQAALEVAQASLLRAGVEDKNAALELRRKEPLAKKDLITQQELDNVRTRRDMAAAALQVATAGVSQAAARRQLLSQQLADARITAPFAGWVATRHLDAGAMLSPGAPVLSLVRTDPIVARFKVSERDIGEIRTRMKSATLEASVRVDTYPDESFVGQVARLAPAIDAASRSAPAEVEIENGDGRLMPGMYCRLTIELGSKPDALLLPVRALLIAPGGDERTNAVFVVEDGAARRVSVQIGSEQGEVAEVIAGLSEQAQVIVQGQSLLKDGVAITVVGESPEPPPNLAP